MTFRGREVFPWLCQVCRWKPPWSYTTSKELSRYAPKQCGALNCLGTLLTHVVFFNPFYDKNMVFLWCFRAFEVRCQELNCVLKTAVFVFRKMNVWKKKYLRNVLELRSKTIRLVSSSTRTRGESQLRQAEGQDNMPHHFFHHFQVQWT